MNFEVGKWYRTRDGRKVRCITTEGHPKWPVSFVNPGISYVTVMPDGKEWESGESEGDILGPWIDKPVVEVDWAAMPAWAHFVAMDSDGEWLWFSGNHPTYLKEGWWPNGEHGRIPPSCVPTFTGDWKDSLVERPAQ